MVSQGVWYLRVRDRKTPLIPSLTSSLVDLWSTVSVSPVCISLLVVKENWVTHLPIQKLLNVNIDSSFIDVENSNYLLGLLSSHTLPVGGLEELFDSVE